MLTHVTKEQYEEALAKVKASVQAPDQATNDDRTLVEVYRFENLDAGVPSYVAYWKRENEGTPARIITWTGATLAVVTACKRYTSRGVTTSTRVAFRALGIDGRTYSGTYYESSGDYVRMKPVAPRMSLKYMSKVLPDLYRDKNRTLMAELVMRTYNRALGRPITQES